MSDAPTSSGPAAQAIFQQALERLLPEERAAYLDEACAGNAALRDAVDALMEEYKERCLREQTVTGAPEAKTSLSEGPGSTIGRYKLLQKIGEGGCGVVFMAEQTEPVQRRVALKIIRLGMDTEEVVARFEAERQALAMMEHPHIAQVLDAGATPAGRPYFVMELVRGVPITKFCDDHRLNTDARLKLFIQVCHAVQHAHQKGVIHRDLKPSNILVTLHDGVPVPKVIDFGIAKATAGRLTDKTLFTAFEQFVGTPAYMSPEQAEMSNLDVDTRSDVYSLGVLLYELLTGQPPLDPEKLGAVGVDEIRRQIREVEAVRPSTQLATLAGATLVTRASLRGTDAPKFVSGIRGDLDWIVMRCLEKDRRRRYDSASALAEDIACFLRNEPIAARPPGNLYLLQKLARRHRAAFATVTAVSLALIIGFGTALRSYFSEKAALINEKAARQQADEETLLARNAKADVQVALSRADYLVALDSIERDQDPEAVAHLVRALRARPDDYASATLLASLLTMRPWLVPVTPPGQGVRQVLNGGRRGGFGGGARGPLGGRRGGLQSPVLSPDGKWILQSVPLERALVRLYDASTTPPRPVSEPMRLPGDVNTGTFSTSDSRQLTTIWSEFGVNNRRPPTHEEIWSFPDRPDLLLALTEAGVVTTTDWSPDGRIIFTAVGDGTARTWDAASGRALSGPMLHDQPLREAAFSPDSKRLATITQDHTLRVWDAASGQLVTGPISLPVPDRPGVRGGPGLRGQPGAGAGLPNGAGGGNPGRGRGGSLAFSPDGRQILVSVLSGQDRFVRVRDAATGQPVPALKNLEAAVVASAIWSPDGRRILTTSGTPGMGVRLWDATTGEVGLELAKDTGQLNTATFSPDGRLMLTTRTGQARLWVAATGEPALADAISQGESTNLRAVFSPDGRRVLTYTGAPEPAARVWDAETGEPISALIQPKQPTANPSGPPAPFSATFSPDGRWILTEGRLDVVGGAGARIWDTATGLPVSVAALGSSVAFSPEGHRLLITDANGGAAVVVFASEPRPEWLLDLAEALARCRLDATGSLVFFQGQSVEELRRRVAAEKDPDQPVVSWARHLLGLTP